MPHKEIAVWKGENYELSPANFLAFTTLMSLLSAIPGINMNDFKAERMADPMDDGKAQVERAGAAAIAEIHTQEKVSILAALDRLFTFDSKGVSQYGICSRCDEEIPLQRIKARPMAERCLRCQQKADAKH